MRYDGYTFRFKRRATRESGATIARWFSLPMTSRGRSPRRRSAPSVVATVGAVRSVDTDRIFRDDQDDDDAPPPYMMRHTRLRGALDDAQGGAFVPLERSARTPRTTRGSTGDAKQLELLYERMAHGRAPSPPAASASLPLLTFDQQDHARAAVAAQVAEIESHADAATLDGSAALFQQAMRAELEAGSSSSAGGDAPTSTKGAGAWYVVGKVVGRGTFGRVQLARHRLSGARVAIKSYFRDKGAAVCSPPPPAGSSSSIDAVKRARAARPPSGESDALEWKRVRQEAKLMASLRPHAGLIGFVEAFETPTQLQVVMEFAGGGSLCELLKKQPQQRLSEPRARRLFAELCGAVDALHRQHVIHRDLKLENVLLDEQLRPRLIDFGFSQREFPTAAAAGSGASVKNFCGTPSYMAPEVVACKSYDGKRVDVWSLGVILYVLLCGKFPFQATNLHQLYQTIRSTAPAFPAGLSRDAQQLVLSILVVDPLKRATLAAIQSHVWLKQTGKGAAATEDVNCLEGSVGEGTATAMALARARAFDSFTAWDDGLAAVCHALARLYGVDPARLLTAARGSPRNTSNSAVALVRLTMLAAAQQREDGVAPGTPEGHGVHNAVTATVAAATPSGDPQAAARAAPRARAAVARVSEPPQSAAAAADQHAAGLEHREQAERADPGEAERVQREHDARAAERQVLAHPLLVTRPARQQFVHERERHERDGARDHRELPDAVHVAAREVGQLHGPEQQQQVGDRGGEHPREVDDAREQRVRDALLVLRAHGHEHARERQLLEAARERDDGRVAHGEPERRDPQRLVHAQHEQHVDEREERDHAARDKVDVVPRRLEAVHDVLPVHEHGEERDARAQRRQRAVLERVKVERDREEVAPRGVLEQQPVEEREEAERLPRRAALEHGPEQLALPRPGHRRRHGLLQRVHARQHRDERQHREQPKDLAHAEPKAPLSLVAEQRAAPVADHLAQVPTQVHRGLRVAGRALLAADHAARDQRVAHDVGEHRAGHGAEQQQRERRDRQRLAVPREQRVEARGHGVAEHHVRLEAPPADREVVRQHAEEHFDAPRQPAHDRDGAELRVARVLGAREVLDVRVRERVEQPDAEIRHGDRERRRVRERVAVGPGRPAVGEQCLVRRRLGALVVVLQRHVIVRRRRPVTGAQRGGGRAGVCEAGLRHRGLSNRRRGAGMDSRKIPISIEPAPFRSCSFGSRVPT